MNNPLIIAYKGEIGSFILNGLLRIMPKALNIFCTDINETEQETNDRIKISDVIFLCIPMEQTLNWLKNRKEILQGKIIIEQCSLKEWLFTDNTLKDLDVRSMHILFRPSQTPNLEDRKVGLIKGQFDEEFANIIGQITQSKVVWFENVIEHDKEMAIQQALLHRTIMILGKELDKCNGSTYIGKKILELRDRICSGNKELYRNIQGNKHLNEHLPRIEENLMNFDIDKMWKMKEN